MSGTQVSSAPNVMFDPLMAGRQTEQQNQLMIQQQGITDHDIAMTGQAAAPLLNLNEDQAAAAWPGWLQEMQSRGLAKYAPATYPGHAATQALVQRAMPLMDQFKVGYITPPGTQAAIDAALRPGGGAGGGTGTGGGGGGGRPLTGDLETDRKIISQRESGGDPAALNYVAVADPTAYGRGATASGKYQFVNSTWRDGMQLAGLDPTQYPTAMSAPEAVQDKVFTAVYGKYGTKPWDPSTYGQAWVPAPGGRMVLVKGAPATATTAGAPGSPQAPPGVQMGGAPPAPPGGATGPYTGGGMGAVLAPGGPGGRRLTQAERLGGTEVAGPPMVASTNPTAAVPATDSMATPARYAGATPAPSAEAQPETGWGSQVGSGYGPQNALAPTPPTQPAVPAAQQPPAQQQPPAPATRANLPRAADVPTGVNSQQYRDAADLQRRALILEAQVDPTGRLKQLAAGLRQQAQLLLQTDSVVQTVDGQLHALTGVIDKTAAPLPHYVYDANAGGPGVPGFVDTTGTNKPEFEPAQRDAAVAQRTVMDLGPKIAAADAGTGPQVSPEDRARYNVAATTYQQFKEITDPVTQQIKQVPTRPLPDGLPQPAGGGRTLTAGLSPAQQQIERDKGRYAIAADDLKHDRGEISAIGDAGRSAQQDNLRVQEMRDILTNASTGPGTETAAHIRAWIARWTPGQLAEWDGSGANLSNPAAIEMFQKLGFVGAVTQERGSTPRGGYQATKMFQQFNPGAQLLTSTNQGLLAQRLIANQAEADYAQAAQDHYNTQRERLKSPEQNYDPLSSFDAKWQAQRNPQVYAAAIGALGGQDGDMWSRGLSKDEIQRVKEVVTRADPKAVVNMPGDAPTGRNRPPLTSFQR